MKKFFKRSRFRKLFFSLEIVILSSIPVCYTWGKLAIGGDNLIPFNSLALEKYLYQWIPVHNGQYLAINYYPQYFFYKLAELAGLSIYQISALLFFLLGLIAGFGIYRLIKLIYHKESFVIVVPIAFYLLSPALLNKGHYIFIYSFAPWFFYFTLKFIKTKQIKVKDLIFLNIILFFSFVDLPNPKYIFHLFFGLLMIYIFALIFKLISFDFLFKNLRKLLLFFMLSSYLFFPLGGFALRYHPDDYGVHFRYGKHDGIKMTDYKIATLGKMIRLHNSNVNLNTKEKEAYENNYLVNILSYIFPFLIFLNFLLASYNLVFIKREKEISKIEVMLFVLTLGYLFFAVGPNPPLGFVYQYIVSNYTLFGFLRTTAGAVFFLSIFYSVLIFGFIEKLKRLKLLLIFFLIITILVISYPIINGEYYLNLGNANPCTDQKSYGFVVPEEYFEMKSVIDTQKLDAKTLHTQSNLLYIKTDWGFFGPIIYNFLYNNYNIGADHIYSNYAYHNIGFLFNDRSLFDIKKDISLEGTVNFAENDFLELSKVSRERFLPHVYSAKQVIYADRDIDSLLPALSTSPDYKAQSAVYLNKGLDEKKLSNLEKLNFYNVEFETKRILSPALSNLSFEEGLWTKKPLDCSKSDSGEPNLSMKLSTDSTDGRYSLELGSQNHNACTTISLPVDLRQGKKYRFSFDYKNIKGGLIGYYCNLIGKSQHSLGDGLIKINSRNWNSFEKIIQPEEDVKRVEIAFYAPSNGAKEVLNRYDNVRLDLLELRLGKKRGQKKEQSSPMLEFRKINPTKYRVRIHDAKKPFPLVFSENYHKDWKIYLAKNLNLKSKDKLAKETESYKVLDGNEGDQASPEELKGFINKSWITTLGNLRNKEMKHWKYKNGKKTLDYIENYDIEFVSKNFQNSIQNNNIGSGNIWDTWLSKPQDEDSHLIVNDYANSWIIDPAKICLDNKLCQIDSSGKYSFDMIIEFWPQRLFYWGAFLSAVFLAGSLIYVVKLHE